MLRTYLKADLRKLPITTKHKQSQLILLFITVLHQFCKWIKTTHKIMNTTLQKKTPYFLQHTHQLNSVVKYIPTHTLLSVFFKKSKKNKPIKIVSQNLIRKWTNIKLHIKTTHPIKIQKTYNLNTVTRSILKINNNAPYLRKRAYKITKRKEISTLLNSYNTRYEPSNKQNFNQYTYWTYFYQHAKCINTLLTLYNHAKLKKQTITLLAADKTPSLSTFNYTHASIKFTPTYLSINYIKNITTFKDTKQVGTPKQDPTYDLNALARYFYEWRAHRLQRNKRTVNGVYNITIKKNKEHIFETLFSYTQLSIDYNNITTTIFPKYNPLLKIVLKSPQTLIETTTTFQTNNLKLKHTALGNYLSAITNYTPLFYFNQLTTTNTQKYLSLLTKYYFQSIGSLRALRYKNFFIYFLINFLETFLNKQLWVRIDSRDILTTEWKKNINMFCFEHMYLYKKFNRLISVRELFEILVISLTTRDLQILLMFLKQRFEKAHFKKHKKILSILFDVLRKNRYMLAELGVKGFFFDIRGKVGVSGNAKKRHLSFTIGKITTTSQNVKSYWQQINVWTPTGQMGITCYVLY